MNTTTNKIDNQHLCQTDITAIDHLLDFFARRFLFYFFSGCSHWLSETFQDNTLYKLTYLLTCRHDRL